MPCRLCCPSTRLIVVVNGVSAPAWMFVLPAVSDGSNGRGLAHAEPFGPLVIWNSDDGSAAAFPDHGAMAARVA
jgi:hypothetical protein